MKPGQKLCINCIKKLSDDKEEIQDDDLHVDCLNDSEFTCSEREKLILNESGHLLGVSPIKSVGKRDALGYGKQKVKRFKENITSLVASAYELDEKDMINADDKCRKCGDFDKLIEELKTKMTVSSKEEKIQILTLAPVSWSIEKTCSEFSTSEHMVKKARKVKNEFGILAKPSGQKGGRALTDEVKEKVTEIFESDEFTRICPGKKDFVSIHVNGIKEHKQKRLILVRLKELFIEFKKVNPELKIGFSKFCELRPKWCVTVNSSGTHSVCVCSYHQNSKLMCSVLPNVPTDSYKGLMSLCVCDINDRNCMFHLCSNCPGKSNLSVQLTNIFTSHGFDSNDELTYKQWISTDRTSLVKCQTTVGEFVDLLSDNLYQLCQHHFIKEEQSSYLRTSKETLDCTTCIILMDFAENFSFIIQDAIQGFYWQNEQATLHPFAVYLKDGNGLKCESYCVISDHLQHDQTAVHCFLTALLPIIRNNHPHLKVVKYFSDGAASQYKNFKSLGNLMYHQKDHGLKAEHHFFATSHGKSPCDGIGGTIKREAAKASLRATTTNQILSPQDLYTWAETNVPGVRMIFITTDDIQKHETEFNLADRYASFRTVPGTRSYHCFIPEGDKLILKRILKDLMFDTHQFCCMDRRVGRIYQTGKYIACFYDDDWYVGLIIESSAENEDVKVKFMKRRGLNLQWANEAMCWVPFTKVICEVNAPSVKGNSARDYALNKDDYEKIARIISDNKK